MNVFFFKFYMINDASKLMYTFRGDNEILHDFLKKTYVQTLYDQTYLKSERHAKVKEESLEKFGKTSEDLTVVQKSLSFIKS